mgnify:CR=1 FL=1
MATPLRLFYRTYKIMDNYNHTFQTWNKLAAAYQDKFMNLDLYDDTYNLFCECIEKPGAKIFEIGCGPGNVTKYLLHKRPDFKIEAIDVAPSMIELAKENNPAADFKTMDCREIDTLTPGFDAVMCGFCMPYLTKADCTKLIKDCAHLLNSGGIFYFSAIEDDYDKSGYETSSNGEHKMYVYYHEAAYLEEALKTNDFDLIDIKRKNYPKSDGTSSTHIIFMAKRK